MGAWDWISEGANEVAQGDDVSKGGKAALHAIEAHPYASAIAAATLVTLPVGGEGGGAVAATAAAGRLAIAGGERVMSSVFVRATAARLASAAGKFLGTAGKDVALGAAADEGIEGAEKLGGSFLRKMGRGAWKAGKGVGKAGMLAGDIAGGAASFLGNYPMVGSAAWKLLKWGAIYEAFEHIREWIRDDFIGKNGDRLALANASRAKAEGINPNGMAGPETASVAAPTNGLTPQKVAAYGLKDGIPQGQLDRNQIAHMSVTRNGQTSSLILPYMRGRNDAETLQRSTEYWNSESAAGRVPPLKDGMQMSIGPEGSARTYALEGGSWHNIGVAAYANVEQAGRSGIKGMEVSPEVLKKAMKLPGDGAAGVMAAGLGVSAQDFMDGKGGRVFANRESNGGYRLTAVKGDLGHGSSEMTSVMVNKSGQASVIAGREEVGAKGLFRKDVVVDAGKDLRISADRGIVGNDGVREKAASAARIAGTSDDLDKSIQGSRLQGLDGRVVHSIDEKGKQSALASVSGRGMDGQETHGVMLVKNGKAELAIYREGAKFPSWSKEISDKGFSVGKDGTVSLSGRAADVTRGFMSDPRKEAAALRARDLSPNGAMGVFARTTPEEGFAYVQNASRNGRTPVIGAGMGR